MRAHGIGPREIRRLALVTGLLAGIVAAAAAGTGNYLIVTAPSYSGSVPLTQFANAKTGMGFTVSTYVVPTGTSNTSIRNYIKGLWGGPNAPAYILLVGDTDGSTSGAATIPHFTGGGSKSAPTDLPYGCMDTGDDWYPEVPVGRFPVRDTNQLAAIVEKTLYVEAGSFPNPDYVRKAAFLATDDSSAQAEATHEWVITNYLEPADYTAIRIYGALGGGTEEVTAAVNAGCLFVNYFGHSSSSGWWTPSFDQSDINALSNLGLYGLAFGFSCNTANFPTSECSGETWVRAYRKGSAAYISASTFIYYGGDQWDSSRHLEKDFWASFFVDDIWEVGPAWKAGLYRFLAEPEFDLGIKRNMFEMFVLFGDPALRLPGNDGFGIAATPNSQDVCTTLTNEAQYAVHVDKYGSFNEPVTLRASSIPPGTFAHFSPNGLVPPYDTVMTIDYLSEASPGSYTIHVDGDGGGVQKTTTVGLNLAAGVPTQPSLTSPPNGLTDAPRQPTLAWQPVAQAVGYDVQIAVDSSFNSVVYSASAAGTSHAVGMQLGAATQYYWHVRANNGCGNSNYSSPFSFTTLDQADYFTQLFTGGFDLDNRSITLVPNGGGSFYYLCGGPITQFPTDPAGGTPLTFSPDRDDGYATVNLTGGNKVSLYGVDYTTVYAGTNGYLTFTSGQTLYNETLQNHFGVPRVAALLDDLDLTSAGTASWRQLADRVAFTYQNVPQWSGSDSNNFQIEMFFDGMIRISWLQVDTNDCLAGISAGSGVPADFIASDLSAAGQCLGACCVAGQCLLLGEAGCTSQEGEFHGLGSNCTPELCAILEPGCVIISELIDGTLSGSCPRFVELTNTGTHDYTFPAGGLIIQTDFSTDVTVDVNLTGVTVPAGQSIVINSNEFGACTGAFEITYGFPAEVNVNNVQFGDGNDRYILTDTADGSNLIDIYGEFGAVPGVWSYQRGYSYRLPQFNAGVGGTFVPEEWFFGGKNSLVGPDPELLLHTLTTPGEHTYFESCPSNPDGDLDGDGDVDLDDFALLPDCLMGPDIQVGIGCLPADSNFDNDVDLADFAVFAKNFGL